MEACDRHRFGHLLVVVSSGQIPGAGEGMRRAPIETGRFNAVGWRNPEGTCEAFAARFKHRWDRLDGSELGLIDLQVIAD